MNMVICPSVWIRPEVIARVDKGILFAVLTAFLFSGAAMLIGLLLHRIMQGEGYKTHLAPCLAVPGFAALVGFLRFGLSVTAVQGVFLACLLLYALCSDLTDHHMDDHIWVTVLALGLCSVGRFGIVSMLIGAAIGCFNGFFVAKFKLHPFIVTLGTQLILYTVLLLYVQQGNNKGMAISNLDPSYTGFVKGSLFSIGGTPIPNYVLFAIVLTAVMWFVWNKTTFGKNMFALGSNEEAARVSGVNVFGVTVGVFALAGAMYGFTGFIEGARIGSNTANTGLNYELDAIAACVIGGVSFVGGIGKIRGIVIGVVMLRLIFVGLTMVGVPQDLQYLIKGAIILFACALDMRKYLVKK